MADDFLRTDDASKGSMLRPIAVVGAIGAAGLGGMLLIESCDTAHYEETERRVVDAYAGDFPKPEQANAIQAGLGISRDQYVMLSDAAIANPRADWLGSVAYPAGLDRTMSDIETHLSATSGAFPGALIGMADPVAPAVPGADVATVVEQMPAAYPKVPKILVAEAQAQALRGAILMTIATGGTSIAQGVDTVPPVIGARADLWTRGYEMVDEARRTLGLEQVPVGAALQGAFLDTAAQVDQARTPGLGHN